MGNACCSDEHLQIVNEYVNNKSIEPQKKFGRSKMIPLADNHQQSADVWKRIDAN